ncbi:hypothetical protein LOC68_10055 [Blastopirellula sp. JC732]|uniref:Uncharacterized protein n=1 Tax=Blastopirellula sediminis TaxID=2894196 RepID=A0A9X1MLW9_9BACT|nr:hypothetical protein [Blastopirellula sediminis]MCC9608481.1 hypothetical protein [Blastopirellula sediminis]MCC9628742.1 hypothetical protein [Blastopirellula sediminis]
MRSEFFPIRLQPSVTAADFRFYSLGDASEYPEASDWFGSWLRQENVEGNIRQLQSVFGCDVIADFTARLFHAREVAGVLVCTKEEKRNSPECWLVLQKRGGSSGGIDLNLLLSSQPGDFVFLREPAFQIDRKRLKQLFELNLVNRFFLTYDGLRESPPYFGIDNFNRFPLHEADPRMILSRQRPQKEWLDSSIIHVSGGCDYLLLRPDGVVGYMPIEMERYIEIYASGFAEAIDHWLASGCMVAESYT